MNIKILTPLCELCKTGFKYKPRNISTATIPGLSRVSESTEGIVSELFKKVEILTKYGIEKGFNPEEVIKRFNESEKYLDKFSIDRLLTLTKEGKIKIFEKPKVRLASKKFYFDEIDFEKDARSEKTKQFFLILRRGRATITKFHQMKLQMY